MQYWLSFATLITVAVSASQVDDTDTQCLLQSAEWRNSHHEASASWKQAPSGRTSMDPLPGPPLPAAVRPPVSHAGATGAAPVKCLRSPIIWKAAVASVCLAVAWLLAYGMWLSLRGPQAPVQQEPSVNSTASNDRIPFIDNAKFLMLVAVVFFHAQLPHLPLGRTPFAILIFHMRGFVFLSGMMAKDTVSLRKMAILTIRLIVPFISFVVIICPLSFFTKTGVLNFPHVLDDLTARQGTFGWYLLALLAWRFFGCLLQPLEHYGGLRFAIAMVFCVLGDFGVRIFEPPGKIYGRIACLFPVYVAGQMFPLTWLSKMPSVGVTSMTLGSLLMASCFYVESFPGVIEMYLDQIPPYGDMRPSCGDSYVLLWIPTLFKNMFELSKAFVILLCFCPRSRCIITEWGENSMYPYLLQSFCVGLAWQNMPPATSISMQLLMGLGLLTYSAVCTAILATRPVRMIFGALLEPVWLTRLLGLQKPAPDTALPAVK